MSDPRLHTPTNPPHQEQDVETKLLYAAYKRKPLNLQMTVAVTVICGSLLWRFFPANLMTVWIIAILSSATLGYVEWTAFQRAAPTTDYLPRWQRLFLAQATASGAAWALGPTLMIPQATGTELALFIGILLSVCGVAMISVAEQRAAMQGFIAAALTPPLIALWFTGDDIERLVSMVLVCGMVLMILVGRRLNQAMRELLEVQYRMHTVLDTALDAVIGIDARGRITDWNLTAKNVFGWTKDEALGLRLEDTIIPEQHREAHRLSLARFLATGEQQNMNRRIEITAMRRNGEEFPMELAITPLKTRDTYYFTAFISDISERKLMEGELKASEAKFRSIIEVSPVPLALNDERMNITFLNPAFVNTFGYNLDDIPTLADWWLKAYPDPNYRHWVKTAWRTTQEKVTREQIDFLPLEVAIRCKNNSIKTVLVSAAAIHQDFSDIHVAILYDITQRKQIEAKLDAIFNASVEGIITFSLPDTIVSTNAAVETIFGYTPKELVGCSINQLLPSMPKAINDYSLLHTVKPDGQIQEIEGVHKNGSVIPIDLSIAEYSIDNIQYFTYIVRNVSLRKHREQQDKIHLDQLAHVTRLGLMGEMASGIAHEVNQPLSAISSYTQVSLNLINTENPDLVKLTEILSKTQQQALRAGQIIHRMREFVKSHSKHRSTADINELINETVELCIAELKHHAIHIIFELENNLPLVYVDQIQIEQVLINLIRNSIDALQNLPARQLRQLTIQSYLTLDNSIQVRVKDNGSGLNKLQQQKILMPFYTTKTDGMGMGLSISRSLIEAHEGTMHFNSEPGKGSTFYFTLPIKTI